MLSLVLFDPWFAPLAFIVINSCYGAGFACLPAVLNDHYGKNELSFIHGLCLSSWGMASLAAFLISVFILSIFTLNQNILFMVLATGYSINLLNILILRLRK